MEKKGFVSLLQTAGLNLQPVFFLHQMLALWKSKAKMEAFLSNKKNFRYLSYDSSSTAVNETLKSTPERIVAAPQRLEDLLN